MTNLWQETLAQLERWMIHMKRQPFHMLFSLFQPIVFLVLFGGMFTRVLAEGPLPGANFRSFILPGIVALTVFSNAMFGGVAILFDKELGFLSRLLAAPISRASIILARFLFTNLQSTVQALIIIVFGVILGARISTGIVGVLVMLLMGFLLGLGITAMSLVLAFRLRGHADFFALLAAITLPMVFASSAFAPLESLPEWLRGIAYVNPLTWAVEGMRDAVVASIDGVRMLKMTGVLLAFDVVAVLLGVRVLKRELAP